MGTTADKGAYLKDTKSLLKQKINNLGGSIDEQTTFREYVDELQDVYDNLPKTSFQTGTEVTLENCLKGKLDFEEDNGKKVVGIGQSSQESTNGYNLFVDIATQTLNGMTITRTDNGYILNGTSTAVTTFRGTISTPINSNKTLVAKCDTDIANANIQIKTKSATQVQLRSISLSTKETWVVSSGEYEDCLCDIVVKSGVTLNNVLVQPMLLEGTYTTSNVPNYEQYTGGQASPNPSYPQQIKSVTGNQDVVVSGLNCFDTSNLAENTSLDVKTTFTNEVMKLKGKSNNSGNILSSRTTSKTLKAGSYTFKSFKLSGSATFPDQYADFSFGVRNSTASLGALSLKNVINNSSAEANFTIETDTELYFSIYSNRANIDCDVEIGLMIIKQTETASQFEPYITPTSYQLSLGDIELNAIGNYKDELVTDRSTGKWYVHKAIGKTIIDGTKGNWSKPSTNRFNLDDLPNDYKKQNGQVLCVSNLYIAYAQCLTNGDFNNLVANVNYGIDLSSSTNATTFTLRIKDTNFDVASDYKTWLGTHNLILYYVLATATDTEITDTSLIEQLEALYNAHSNNGTTIITSNGNLPMIIKVRGLKGE